MVHPVINLKNSVTLKGHDSLLSQIFSGIFFKNTKIHQVSVVKHWTFLPQVTLNVGGVAADENFTMCGPSFQV